MVENSELRKAGLKVTLPRVKILEILQDPNNQHISAEDVYKLLLEIGEDIGLATVYRVLNQFDDAGILTRHHFEGGKSVFELTGSHHHDHHQCERYQDLLGAYIHPPRALVVVSHHDSG